MSKVLGHVKNKVSGVAVPFFDFDANGYEVQKNPFIDREWVSNKEWIDITGETKQESYLTPQNEFEKALINTCIDLAQTLIKKNRDYGSSYAKMKEEYGDLALIIRQSDKLERLKTLQKQDSLVSESTTDTKRDGAGYYILDLAYEEVNNGTTNTM